MGYTGCRAVVVHTRALENGEGLKGLLRLKRQCCKRNDWQLWREGELTVCEFSEKDSVTQQYNRSCATTMLGQSPAQTCFWLIPELPHVRSLYSGQKPWRREELGFQNGICWRGRESRSQ